MEITFQNKREDFQAFYDYMVKETEQGKMISKRIFSAWLTSAISLSLLIGALMWGVFEKWQVGFGVTFSFLLLADSGDF